MGAVHSLLKAQNDPGRLRRRFDLAVASLESDRSGAVRALPQTLVFGGIFFLPLQATGQVVDEMLRDATLFGLSCARQQLRFFCLIP